MMSACMYNATVKWQVVFFIRDFSCKNCSCCTQVQESVALDTRTCFYSALDCIV